MNNFRVWGCEKLRVSEMSSHNYSNSDTTWMEQFQDNIKPHLHLTSIMCCIHQDLIRLWIFGKDLLIFIFTATMVIIMLILSICFLWSPTHDMQEKNSRLNCAHDLLIHSLDSTRFIIRVVDFGQVDFENMLFCTSQIHISTHTLLFLYADSQLIHVDLQYKSFSSHLFYHPPLSCQLFSSSRDAPPSHRSDTSYGSCLLLCTALNVWLNLFIRNVGEIFQFFRHVSWFTKHSGHSSLSIVFLTRQTPSQYHSGILISCMSAATWMFHIFTVADVIAST